MFEDLPDGSTVELVASERVAYGRAVELDPDTGQMRPHRHGDHLGTATRAASPGERVRVILHDRPGPYLTPQGSVLLRDMVRELLIQMADWSPDEGGPTNAEMGAYWSRANKLGVKRADDGEH